MLCALDLSSCDCFVPGRLKILSSLIVVIIGNNELHDEPGNHLSLSFLPPAVTMITIKWYRSRLRLIKQGLCLSGRTGEGENLKNPIAMMLNLQNLTKTKYKIIDNYQWQKNSIQDSACLIWVKSPIYKICRIFTESGIVPGINRNVTGNIN